MQADLADEPIYRGGGQIIPTSRRVTYSSFLLANPRIMEPMNFAEVLCPKDCIEVINNLLIRRRGHISLEEPIGGSPFYSLKVEVPALEIFGLETDIRTATMGQAMILSWFEQGSAAILDDLNIQCLLVFLKIFRKNSSNKKESAWVFVALNPSASLIGSHPKHQEKSNTNTKNLKSKKRQSIKQACALFIRSGVMAWSLRHV